MIALVKAFHPEPAAAVTGITGLLAVAVGHPPTTAALVTATVAASQLAVGWSNDALDATRDKTAGRDDKPIPTGALSRRTVAAAGAAAAAAAVGLALSFPPAAATAMIIALVSALAYNWPLKSTPLSVVPYAVSFGALPAFVVLALPAAPPVWLVAAGALLGAGAHFANVLPDLADDAATGVRGLPHRLGPTGAGTAAVGLLLTATAVLVIGPPGPPPAVGVAAAGTALVVLPIGWYAARVAAGAGRRPTAMFRAVLLVALINVVLLLAAGTVV